MRVWTLCRFGEGGLECREAASPTPGPGEVRIDVKALSLNYRDVLVVSGQYHRKLPLPAVPISDGAGVVSAVGPGVTRVKVGEGVMTHFVSGWLAGPYRAEYLSTSLGTPAAGLAAEQVVLPEHAVLPVPRGFTFEQAATLPIAALTAWSALGTGGGIGPGQTVLTLGTGGVSIFALQLGKALGARVIVTSSSEAKLARARRLGADHGIDYARQADWDRSVLELTQGEGVDLVVENGGIATLARSLRAVRAGGTIALLGALTGLRGELDVAPILMKRVAVQGILVDSRERFAQLVEFLGEHRIEPVIDVRFPFAELPAALAHMQAGKHFGKIVIAG